MSQRTGAQSVDIWTNTQPDGSGTNVQPIADLTGHFLTAGFNIPSHDYVGLTYTGDNVTEIIYKTGGAGGTTVATLTLAYSGTNVTSITKS